MKRRQVPHGGRGTPRENTNGRREVIGDVKYSVNVNGTEATRKLEIFIERVIVEYEGKNPALTDLKKDRTQTYSV